jgi:hypothetical protein
LSAGSLEVRVPVARRWSWPHLDLPALDERQVVQLSTGITCVLILLAGPKEWYVSVVASAVAALAVLLPQLREHPATWMFLAVAMLTGAFEDWEQTDNHKYLMAYWCFCIALATRVENSREFMARSGRLLIGTCFAFAIYWKVRSPDFISADFFRVQLLTDPRFASVATWLGGVSVVVQRDLQWHWAALNDISELGEFQGFKLPISERLQAIATVMTWWTLFIETWIAASFLASDRSWLGRGRSVPLLVFVVTTYSVATVVGFGYVLLAMSFCQTRSTLARLSHLVAFIVIFFFQIPLFALSGDELPKTP